MKDLRYQKVVLYVPYREGDTDKPGNWDWWSLTDCAEPVFVCSDDEVPYRDMHEMLVTNGFRGEDDLAGQLVKGE